MKNVTEDALKICVPKPDMPNENQSDESSKDEIIETQKNQTMEQEKIIEEKGKCIETLTHRKEKANSIANVPGKREVKPVPKHLSKVHDIHRNELLGYRMKADGHAGGDCLSSVSTMHLSYTKNKFERQKI